MLLVVEAAVLRLASFTVAPSYKTFTPNPIKLGMRSVRIEVVPFLLASHHWFHQQFSRWPPYNLAICGMKVSNFDSGMQTIYIYIHALYNQKISQGIGNRFVSSLEDENVGKILKYNGFRENSIFPVPIELLFGMQSSISETCRLCRAKTATMLS